MTETKQEKFIRLAEKRVPNAADALRIVGSLGSNNYEAPEGAVEEISTYLRGCMTDALKALGAKAPPRLTATPATPPDYGGPEWVLVAEALELLAQGHADIAKQKLKAALSY